MEIRPIDKTPELTELLRIYNPLIHSKNDNEYDWLGESSVCIEIPNPCGADSIKLVCDNGEFILCFSYFHSHYCADDNGYGTMCEQLSELLDNKTCCATVFCGSENKWIGSTLLEKDKLSLPIEEIFGFIFDHGSYKEQFSQNGGEARFTFWDSSLNKNLKL